MFDCDLALLQQIYSEREPYVEQIRLGGTTLIFDDVFIRLCDEAFANDCLLKMSEDELLLFNKLISYQDGTLDPLEDSVVALDVWLTNLANEIENPSLGECER